MNASEFRELLIRAISGDKKAIEEILCMYMPLINQYSVVDGRVDQDLKQSIMLHIILSIRRFRLEY